MNKIQSVINIVMTLMRQYWKYKNHDIGMKLAFLLVSGGITLLISGISWRVLISIEIFDIPTSIDISPDNLYFYGVFSLVAGSIVGVYRLSFIQKQTTGILIIHRGMEGMSTTAIQHALPKSFSKGKLEIIDLHEGHQINEGKVISPGRALEVVNGLDQQIKTRLNGRDISEVKLAYGGLAPIPLLVTAGYRITSRQECLTLDYSRAGTWHGLDDIDDMEEISIIAPNGEIKDDVAVILPFSVEISETQLPNSLSGKSYIIHLENGARPDSLNSTDKQKRIATEFYTLCANMKAKHPDFNEIHLFLASQASFAFRLGTMLTTSVMPKISVYQYDSATGKYDWGVTISAGNKPVIIGKSNII